MTRNKAYKALEDIKELEYPKNTEKLAQVVALLRKVIILQQGEIDILQKEINNLQTSFHSNQKPLS